MWKWVFHGQSRFGNSGFLYCGPSQNHHSVNVYCVYCDSPGGSSSVPQMVRCFNICYIKKEEKNNFSGKNPLQKELGRSYY